MRKNLINFLGQQSKNRKCANTGRVCQQPPMAVPSLGGGRQSPKGGEETGFRQRYHVSCPVSRQSAAACCTVVASGRGVQVSISSNYYTGAATIKNAIFKCPACRSLQCFHSSFSLQKIATEQFMKASLHRKSMVHCVGIASFKFENLRSP
jgi:hypothetical protein